MPPRETLTKGASLLRSVLSPNGFAFAFRKEGEGAGGFFAVGEFVRGDRRLELHFRQSLGLVIYHVGTFHASHDAYMKELGVRDRAAYPGFSEDPLDGFRHLAHDLERFAEDFRVGDGVVVVRAARREHAETESRSRILMAGYVGDDRKRQEAKLKFDARDWQGAVTLLESLQYPDLMDAPDRRRLQIARQRGGAGRPAAAPHAAKVDARESLSRVVHTNAAKETSAGSPWQSLKERVRALFAR
jgi:hypothetical protein